MDKEYLKEAARAIEANNEAENPPTCPQCGKQTRLQSFGPFFMPDPVYRFAYECPDKHWRGTMGQSATEMLRARKPTDTPECDAEFLKIEADTYTCEEHIKRLELFAESLERRLTEVMADKEKYDFLRRFDNFRRVDDLLDGPCNTLDEAVAAARAKEGK